MIIHCINTLPPPLSCGNLHFRTAVETASFHLQTWLNNTSLQVSYEESLTDCPTCDSGSDY